MNYVKHFVNYHGEIEYEKLPGYKILLKAFLLEMQNQRITEYPDAFVACSLALLDDSEHLNTFLSIVFTKTSLHDSKSVEALLSYVNAWL